MSKGGTTSRKLSFFGNLCQFTKIYVNNFVPSKLWWIADCGFNNIKHIFIQIFVQVDPHVDYIRFGTLQFWNWNTKNCFVLPL